MNQNQQQSYYRENSHPSQGSSQFSTLKNSEIIQARQQYSYDIESDSLKKKKYNQVKRLENSGRPISGRRSRDERRKIEAQDMAQQPKSMGYSHSQKQLAREALNTSRLTNKQQNKYEKTGPMYDQYHNNQRIIPIIPLNKIQQKDSHILVQRNNLENGGKSYTNSKQYLDYANNSSMTQTKQGMNRFNNPHISNTGVKQKINYSEARFIDQAIDPKTLSIKKQNPRKNNIKLGAINGVFNKQGSKSSRISHYDNLEDNDDFGKQQFFHQRESSSPQPQTFEETHVHTQRQAKMLPSQQIDTQNILANHRSLENFKQIKKEDQDIINEMHTLKTSQIQNSKSQLDQIAVLSLDLKEKNKEVQNLKQQNYHLKIQNEKIQSQLDQKNEGMIPLKQLQKTISFNINKLFVLKASLFEPTIGTENAHKLLQEVDQYLQMNTVKIESHHSNLIEKITKQKMVINEQNQSINELKALHNSVKSTFDRSKPHDEIVPSFLRALHEPSVDAVHASVDDSTVRKTKGARTSRKNNPSGDQLEDQKFDFRQNEQQKIYRIVHKNNQKAAKSDRR